MHTVDGADVLILESNLDPETKMTPGATTYYAWTSRFWELATELAGEESSP